MDTAITDEFMREMKAAAKNYCVVILRSGPKSNEPAAEKIVWEHGRRNFQLRADGILSIVCPVINDGTTKGIGVFNASLEETRRIMDTDPGVRAGIFEYKAHLCRSFPGDCLAK